MKKVRVKKVYFDKVRDEYPKVGKEFDVEDARADVLVKAGVCELVEEGRGNDGSNGQLPPATTPEDNGAQADPEGDGTQTDPEGANVNPESPKTPEDGSNGQPNKKDKKAKPETK